MWVSVLFKIFRYLYRVRHQRFFELKVYVITLFLWNADRLYRIFTIEHVRNPNSDYVELLGIVLDNWHYLGSWSNALGMIIYPSLLSVLAVIFIRSGADYYKKMKKRDPHEHHRSYGITAVLYAGFFVAYAIAVLYILSTPSPW